MKNKGMLLMIAIAAVVVVVLVLVFANPRLILGQLTPSEQAAVNSGAVILSVSSTQFSGTGENPQSWWIVTLSASPQGQYVYGELTPDEVQTSDGKKPKIPFTVEIDSPQQKLFYSLSQARGTIYTFITNKVIKTGILFSDVWTDQKANDACNAAFSGASLYKVYWTEDTSSDFLTGMIFKKENNFCVYRNKIADWGEVGTAVTNDWQAKIKITVKGIVTESPILTPNNKVWVSSSGKFEARWTGNLVGNVQPPSAAANDVRYTAVTGASSFNAVISVINGLLGGNVFKLLPVNDGTHLNSYTSITTYKNKLDNIDTCFAANKARWTDFQTCATDINSQASSALAPVYDTHFGDSNFPVQLKIDGAYVTVDDQFAIPVITLRIRADTIGVFIRKGQPKILSATSDKFVAGQTGKVNVQVQNIGTDTGSFFLSLQCSKFQSVAFPTVTVAAGDTKTASIDVVTASITEVSDVCTVKATDSGSGLSDSASVTLSATGLTVPQCDASNSTPVCFNDFTKQFCSREGLVQYQQCDYGCSGGACREKPQSCNLTQPICAQNGQELKVEENGTCECVTGGGGGGGGGFNIPWEWVIPIILVGGGGGLLAYAIIKKRRRK